MDNNFENNEKLFRAVKPEYLKDIYVKKGGKISSAAFKDRNGLSVDRGYDRKDIDVVNNMKLRFKGLIVSINVGQCRSVNAIVKYMPSQNIYHSEIHGSNTKVMLNASQARKLAKCALIEG